MLVTIVSVSSAQGEYSCGDVDRSEQPQFKGESCDELKKAKTVCEKGKDGGRGKKWETYRNGGQKTCKDESDAGNALPTGCADQKTCRAQDKANNEKMSKVTMDAATRKRGLADASRKQRQVCDEEIDKAKGNDKCDPDEIQQMKKDSEQYDKLADALDRGATQDENLSTGYDATARSIPPDDSLGPAAEPTQAATQPSSSSPGDSSPGSSSPSPSSGGGGGDGGGGQQPQEQQQAQNQPQQQQQPQQGGGQGSQPSSQPSSISKPGELGATSPTPDNNNSATKETTANNDKNSPTGTFLVGSNNDVKPVTDIGSLQASKATPVFPPATPASATAAGGAGTNRFGVDTGTTSSGGLRNQLSRSLASAGSTGASSEGAANDAASLAKAGIAPENPKRNEDGTWSGGGGSSSSSSSSPSPGATAQNEVLNPFAKPLGDPKFSLMGSETDSAIKKMLGEVDTPAAQAAEGEGLAADGGIGDKNGPSLFQRTHLTYEASLRKGRLRGIAIR